MRAVLKDDDALADADHVGSHAHALVAMGLKRLEQVLRCGDVLGRGFVGRQAEHDARGDDWLYHAGPFHVQPVALPWTCLPRQLGNPSTSREVRATCGRSFTWLICSEETHDKQNSKGGGTPLNLFNKQS